jgi:hypothetical protein
MTIENDEEIDIFDEGLESFSNNFGEAEMIVSSKPMSNPMIDGEMMTAQESFNIISGVNEIPPRYKELAPELLTTLITFNNFRGNSSIAEWQIKSRNNLRNHMMFNATRRITGEDASTITYYNDLLLTNGLDGFARKMSISTLSGVLSEADMESAPRTNNPQKKGFLASVFGRG